MRRALAAFAAFACSYATTAHAIDPIGGDVNKPVPCKAGGVETFFPYGDTWAFLPGNACKGVDPSAPSTGLAAADPAGKQDIEGHCMWVNFDNQGPTPKLGVTDNTAHAERARKVVFSAMLKWAGYKFGKATVGNPEWSCPTQSQPVTTPPSSFVTSASYDFGTGNTGKVTLNFFRGLDVPATVNNAANRGDESECYSACVAGGNCSALMSAPGPNGTTLYKCMNGLTDPAQNRFRYTSVRHNVLWVKGAGKWASTTQQPKSVLASTEVTFWPDNGVIVTADMLFNNENIDFQFHDPEAPAAPSAGCDPNAKDTSSTPATANCFYMETVATHEAGHWLGLGHVACTESVMVASAQSTDEKYDLTKHELAGVCSIYRPSSEGRYPTKSRAGEGCFTDAHCNAEPGMKCLFSKLSFYSDATALASAPTLASKIPHRGVCVKTAPCSTDDDCDKTHGQVCQTVSETANERYCMVGSTDRPRTLGNVGDFCIACDDGTLCNGVCASTGADGLNITLKSGSPPARMCTVKCEAASGCASGFSCQQVGALKLCVPNKPDECIANAQSARALLNQECGGNRQCAAGLECFALNNTSVCLERCTKTQACRTPGYGCVFQLSQDAMGKVTELDTGACFKKDMKEGDNCAAGSSSLCGVTCTGTGTAEKCSPTAKYGCYYDNRGPQFSQCYALCTTGTPPTACPSTSQTCDPLPNVQINGQPAGYCTPVGGNRCLKKTGEACTDAAECETGQCLTLSGTQVCTNYCEIANPSLCPSGTTCVDAGGGKAACKPTGAPLPTQCGGASNNCQCGELSGTNVAEAILVLAALLILRRRRASYSRR
ncbi:MAG: matrixin family metalloprotease [Deltaproteobacteria bacterium]|nr:matrixin family metalloprotease [Deltaproteobacteria bacterium]